MIDHLHVENYKCLRDVSVDLGPFTVLIGSNDSGKSSVLDAIRVIGKTASETIAASLVSEDEGRDDVFDELVWDHDRDRHIGLRIDGRVGEQKLEYRVTMGSGCVVVEEAFSVDGLRLPRTRLPHDPSRTDIAFHLANSPTSTRELKPFLAAFASSTKYRLDPRALRATRPFQSTPVLTSSGDNLPEALDALITGPDRAAITELERALHAAIPTLSGVSLRTLAVPGGIGKEIHFTLSGRRSPISVRPLNASEGILLLTAFLVLAYGESPEILLVEEPENGLHPTRLQTVIDLLRAISTGAVGNRPRQVLVTTHSPLLLNYVKPEEVRIVRRDPERGSSVTPMTAVPNLDALLQEFAVGELWYLLTEEGLLKGEHP